VKEDAQRHEVSIEKGRCMPSLVAFGAKPKWVK
jgi:hypothetical protein